MYLTYQNICIRKAILDDAKLLCTWWNDGRVMAHAGFPDGIHTTVYEVEQLLEKQNDHKRNFMIEIDEHPVGELFYGEIDHDAVIIGIKICRFDKQNQGYGKRILSLFIKTLFQMGYKVIKLDTNLKNTRAQHVYEELGFQKIRVNHNAWKDQRGVFQTSIDYECLEKDFHSYL